MERAHCSRLVRIAHFDRCRKFDVNSSNMDILGQSSLLLAVISFALGFSILARNPKNKLFIVFAGLCTLISGWALFFFLEKIWAGGLFYSLHLLFNIWVGPVSFAFVGVMIRIQDKFSRRCLELSVLSGVLLSGALVFNFDSIPWVLQCIYFAPVFVVIQVLRLMWIDRRLRRGIKRLPKIPTVGVNRRSLIYVGALFVLTTSVMDHAPWLGRVIPVLGNLALIVYLFFISQAISQQRLLNLGALFSRFLVLIAVALTLTIVYSLLVAWIENSPGLFFLNSFIASFLILTLLEPLRSVVGYFTQRLLTQAHRKLQHLLREAQLKLAGTIDPGSLFQAILQTVERVLQPQWAALFVLRGDGTKYRRVRTLGQESMEGSESTQSLREVLASHTLLQYCERLQRRGELPVLLDQMLENEIARSTSRSQREFFFGLLQALKALRCNLLIPLFESNQILGFVTLYAPTPPEPWGSNWGLLQVAYPYFEQAAQTLRNMEVYTVQREKERLATIGEMAAGLAHEIRNPLGAIKGAAQFLDPTADRPESRFLRVIVEEVDRLNHVVTQFLDYSKPYKVEMKALDISALVEKTVELMRPSIKQEVVRLEYRAPALPVQIMGSPEQLQQVLVNLIRNSLKALEGSSSGMIEVSVERSERLREVILAVEDNGCGIKKEHIDKLFIPFFTTSPSGTGLGLSICQRILEAHRGRIEVSTEDGRFSRFSVILPLEARPE
jgi:two-component system, NtrC family, sensor histidine kinase HydH